MKKEKKTYGSISDGAGKRYLLFWLYFVLDDRKNAKKYFEWYKTEFGGDVGEPIHKLCWALSLYRMGEESEAKYILADLMLSNLYFIPKLTGNNISAHRMWHSSNYSAPEYADEIPFEILEAITEDEKQWMAELHDSFEFRRVRKRHIEIYRELEDTRDVKQRKPLVREAGELLNALKENRS